MGLTRPITRELTQILPRQLWQGLSLGKVEQILLDARAALNIHPEQQVGATYLAQKTPTIAGVVEDETPTRKDRTRLSCRASDFDGINQRFYGGNTSTGKTALSVFAWVRPTTLSSTKSICGEFNATADRGWLLQFDGTSLRVIVSADGGIVNAKNYVSTAAFAANSWVQVGFVFSGGVLTLYGDGKVLAVTKTVDGTVATIHDATQVLEVGSNGGGAGYFEGQIQQPLIYEGVWSADQVRDIYLQKTDASITYGWHLDADTAHTLTSSSPALTPANSPSLYEDDAVPVDWLNEKGWNNSGTLAPKRWDEELDSLGNAATDSTSFGTAKRNAQLRGGPCFSFGGTEYATNANLVGTETVVSSEGTSTPTISAGRIDFTAGTCWNLLLSNGSHYAGSERAGIIWHDDVNDEHLTFFNSPNWNLQDTYFWSESVGFSLYEHASEPDLFVPLKSDGTALSITPPSGYTKTSDNPAGPWLYEGDETYVDFDVVPNANQWLEQRWQGAEFDGTTSEIVSASALSGNDFNYIGYYTLDTAAVVQQFFDTRDSGFVANSFNARFGGNKIFLSSGVVDEQYAWTPIVGQEYKIAFSYDSSSGATVVSVDDSQLTKTGGGVIGSGLSVSNPLTVGARADGLFPVDGSIRNVYIEIDSVNVIDQTLLGTSLDLSSQVNHGTDTSVVYNRLTDVSYTAGDVVEQPFSVNDDTSGRVSELIQFTFPVTTLSSTPTISQTVFEDGNTVTQDGILISES